MRNLRMGIKTLLAAGAMSVCVMSFAAYAGTWHQEGDVWQYLDENGNKVVNQWLFENSNWYFLSTEGTMFTGWKKMGNATYYFDEVTGALAKGWKENEDGRRFYYNEEGQMQAGWLKDDGKWYWFDEQGRMVRHTWKTIDGEKYYFTEDGAMAANRYVGLLYMDENGHKDESRGLSVEKKGRVTDTEQKEIEEILANIPDSWLKDFVERGFKVVYEKEKDYISRTTLDDGSKYYKDYVLETGARRIRATSPEGLLQGFGEYIGYRSDIFRSESKFSSDWGFYSDTLMELFELPTDFEDQIKTCFAESMLWYLRDEDSREDLEEAAPNLCICLEKILYPEKAAELEEKAKELQTVTDMRDKKSPGQR